MTDYAPLTLHVPEPAVRPGGTPDFSSVRVPRAGSVARPEVDADPESIRDLAYSIIRVLDRDGRAIGPWSGLLSDEELRPHLERGDTVIFKGTAKAWHEIERQVERIGFGDAYAVSRTRRAGASGEEDFTRVSPVHTRPMA